MNTRLVDSFDIHHWQPDVQVYMGGWDVTVARTIGTLGLGPCIGVAVYDPSTLRGYLSHSFADDLTVLEKMLTRVTDDVSEVASLNCWVSGGDIIPTPSKICERARANTLKLLCNVGIDEDQTEILWIEDKDSAIMTLDCLAGQCEVAHI